MCVPIRHSHGIFSQTNCSLLENVYLDYIYVLKIITQLEFWPNEFRARMDYFLYNLTFPEGEQKNWKSLFKPCASQRLFIPVSRSSTPVSFKQITYFCPLKLC